MKGLPEGFDINELDLSEIAYWPRLVQVIFVSIIMLVLFFGFYWFGLSEKNNIADRLQSTQETLKSDFKKKYAQAQNLNVYQEQKEIVENRLKEVLELLPRKAEVPGLVDDVSNQGIQAGLGFRSIRMRPERKNEFYIELPMEINVIGNYHALAHFSSLIAAMPRLVTFHDFTIAALTPQEFKALDLSSQEDLLRMVMSAKTYRYTEEAEQ